MPRVKNAILNIVPYAEIILFGSRARGNYRPDYDWDFLVVMDEARNSRLKIYQ
ncbi:nucleotidyltransferase domain-containing protein [Neolewinella aurantiaca]|uniref:nucleotidyltransferase domain-containing protein n=1 Tax=Neolewinella aurantiaca TaxID=2602767 RepID=UPI003872B002